MNTQKAVFNRLFSEPKKTELETHKVELGLVDDLNKIKGDMSANIKIAEEEFKNLKKADSNIAKARVEAEKIIKAANVAADKIDASSRKVTSKINKSQEKAANLLEKIEKQAADLGIKATSIPAYKEVDKLYEKVEDANNKVSRYVFENE
jgi:small-conductance mechanosensitive channel